MATPSNVIEFPQPTKSSSKEPPPPTVAGIASFWPEAMRGRFGHHSLVKLHNVAMQSDSWEMVQAALAIMMGYVLWAHPRTGRDRQPFPGTDEVVANNLV